jgi:hypothetical protein
VPLPEDRARPRPTTSPEAEIYRQLIEPESSRRSRKFWRGGLMSVAAAGVLGWLWQSANRARDHKPASPTSGTETPGPARQPDTLSGDAENDRRQNDYGT